MDDKLDTTNNGAAPYKDVPIAIDKRLDIYINNKFYTTLYLTPENLSDTIIGLLVTDKLITSPEKIIALSYKDDRVDIRADVSGEIKHTIYDECLSTKDIDKFVGDNGFRIRWREILEIYRDFNRSTASLRKGLAIHTCGIYLQAGEKIFTRDVSRHVALLKLLGKLIKKGIDAGRSVLITSGRVSSDMIYRAALLDIPIVLSLHGPLSSGLSAAILSGITLIANIKRIEGGGLKVLTHEYRILL